MAELLSKLQADLNASRKAQNKAETLLLGTIVSDVKNREIEIKRDLTDDDVIEVLRRGIKKRRESIDMFEKGNRPELAAVEAAQVKQLEAYLPAGPNVEEIRASVRAAVAGGAANVGAVMSVVMPQFKGRADGAVITKIVREELAKTGVNPHGLAILEFPRVLDIVAGHASSELGAARVRTLSPSTDEVWLESEHGRVAGVKSLRDRR